MQAFGPKLQGEGLAPQWTFIRHFTALNIIPVAITILVQVGNENVMKFSVFLVA